MKIYFLCIDQPRIRFIENHSYCPPKKIVFHGSGTGSPAWKCTSSLRGQGTVVERTGDGSVSAHLKTENRRLSSAVKAPLFGHILILLLNPMP